MVMSSAWVGVWLPSGGLEGATWLYVHVLDVPPGVGSLWGSDGCCIKRPGLFKVLLEYDGME